MSRIIVLGAGGHAKVVIGTLHAMGHSVVGVFDDAEHVQGGQFRGVPILGTTRDAAQAQCDGAVIAIGNARVRMKLAETLPLNWETVIHPRATVDPSAKVGGGSVVFAGAVIQADVEVGSHAIVNTCASLDHDCWVGNYVHLAPGVALGGQVAIGDGTMIGIGASVVHCKSIGSWSMVGAGAAVVHDLPDQVLAMGVPAKVVRRYEG